jgi:DUF1680 family protein
MKIFKLFLLQFKPLCGLVTLCLCGSINFAIAQTGLVNTGISPSTQMQTVGLSDVKLTNGFWFDRMNVCTNTMVPSLWNIYTSDTMCYAFRNFKVAAGIDTGRFRGPSFHDGDFYKTLEAMAANYAYTKNEKINQQMDNAIAVIAKAQKEDGYIYTKSIIEQRKTGAAKMFDDKLSFEAYNFGHLMTAASVHYRATGKSTLLDVAKKATDFLIEFYNNATPEQARNAICPSHYMGIVEMYRTTGNAEYLKLVKKLIDIRGTSQGSDDNSDRVPFRQMKKVNGHAVRANYLFAGVADVYAETGDKSLLDVLDVMWNDVTNKKMYVTGGCGALYDGLSLEGLTYKPDSLQQIQQAYGKDFQLPNKTAHNETCANIGNLLWNWRMFLITADSKYMDIIELELYNAILSGVNLDGDKFFYTNPLEVNKNYPYNLRWSGERQKYISKSNCCPPNAVRTIAEVNNYFYSVFESGVYINLYGSNTLDTWLPSGPKIEIKQSSDYPNNGVSIIEFQRSVEKEIKLYLRVPEWASSYKLWINNIKQKNDGLVAGYVKIESKWDKGDKIKIEFPMETVLLEANPLVEENKNQVAIKRGPVVYCVEKADVPSLYQLNVLAVNANTVFRPVKKYFNNHTVMQLEADVFYTPSSDWRNLLYRKVNTTLKPIKVKFTPYYAWGNRGVNDMNVWLNLMR